VHSPIIWVFEVMQHHQVKVDYMHLFNAKIQK